MPSFAEMMNAYNPVNSSLLDNGADPVMFDSATQKSLNSHIVNKAGAVGSTVFSWFQNPTTFFDDVEKASDAANALLVNNAPAVSAGRKSASKKLTYQNADLAAAYGMNAATAYQEALANTAHQREVADLRAAGLNPVLSASQGRGAGSVTTAEPVAVAPAGASNSASGFQSVVKNVKDVLNLVKLAKSVF